MTKEPINAPSEGQSSGAQLTNRGEVMNPPASAAQGAEAGNLNTPHRHGLGASPQGDAAQATPIPAAPSVVLSSNPLRAVETENEHLVAQVDRLEAEIERLNALWECEHATVMRLLKEAERLRAVLQKYKYESRLQTFEDRQRFRQEADEALRPAVETTAPQSIGGGPFGCEHNWNGSGPCPICHR